MVTVRCQVPSWLVPETRVMDPNPAVWVVVSEVISIVGALAPVASVRWAVTVTSLGPELTSTFLGVKSNPERAGAAVSGWVTVQVWLAVPTLPAGSATVARKV